MWKPLGVEVSLNNMEWNAYQVAKDSGDFMLARSFLFGDYVEPSSMLGSFRCQDPQNESGYCNPPSMVCCSRPPRPWMPTPGPGSIIRPSNC
jgi:ABC-type oligopeptide transport system substrate-binding subunit